MSKFNNQKPNYKKKAPNATRKQPNFMRLPIVFASDISESVINEAVEIIRETKFNKISFPVSVYRHLVDENVAADDTRTVNTGYVKTFDPESNEATVVIFNNNRATIEAFKKPALVVVLTQYNGHLGTITKLNIVDLGDDEVADTTEPEEVVETADAGETTPVVEDANGVAVTEEVEE